ncbi:MAG: S-layer homology domain-containing protein, partial [Schwartzia sp.]|nr:S-layer homology domain-containing protein [Schwartzia sp. (in: firmicutes)]
MDTPETPHGGQRLPSRFSGKTIFIIFKEEFCMKKTLVSALTTALVVGAASTTFAAANPFEDVPADHWAYDAIAQLAADGVIEGYGDGTYRGDQEITRYEMAQMIARAMAKGGGDKALIDKLAAEFADELNNLGVRVAALEKKVDNVKWGGRIRYRYIHMNHEAEKGRNAVTKDRENV